MTRPELESEFRRLLGDVPEELILQLLGAVSERMATVIEERCRPDDRWAPRRRRDWGEARDQRRQDRRTA